ncbi:MAG: CBS domain-containing protein, partial [Proteobacteria bacterium]|nr:CBS domain-containing protein [Pseudomonadota bacterium]
MIVSMWMTRELATVTAETPIVEAARLMARRRIRRLPVLGSGGRLAGIVTATDLLHAFPPDVNPFAIHSAAAERSRLTVGEIAHAELATVRPDEPIEVAASLMRERKVGGLPVLRDGRLVGIITESDVFRAFVSLFAAGERGLRVTFDATRCAHPFQTVAELAAGRPLEVRSLVLSRQEDTPVAVVRVEGDGAQAFVDALWAAGHRVLHVLPVGPA